MGSTKINAKELQFQNHLEELEWEKIVHRQNLGEIARLEREMELIQFQINEIKKADNELSISKKCMKLHLSHPEKFKVIGK
jgi:hypothetical protein